MPPQHKRALVSIAALWVCDFGFNILAAGVVMRYQLFILIMETTFSIYFIQLLLQSNPVPNTPQHAPEINAFVPRHSSEAKYI